MGAIEAGDMHIKTPIYGPIWVTVRPEMLSSFWNCLANSHLRAHEEK